MKIKYWYNYATVTFTCASIKWINSGRKVYYSSAHFNNSVNHWCCCLLRPILVAKQVNDRESSTQDSLFSLKKANNLFHMNAHICNSPCLFNINRIELTFLVHNSFALLFSLYISDPYLGQWCSCHSHLKCILVTYVWKRHSNQSY